MADNDEVWLLSKSEVIFAKYEELGLKGLTDKEKVFRLVWQLEAEVNNGGFEQFFFNSSGDERAETIKALDVIGAVETRTILLAALEVFENSNPPINQTRRQNRLLELNKAEERTIDENDAAFWAYPDNLSQLLLDFMRRN